MIRTLAGTTCRQRAAYAAGHRAGLTATLKICPPHFLDCPQFWYDGFEDGMTSRREAASTGETP